MRSVHIKITTFVRVLRTAFFSYISGTLMTQFDKPTGASNYPLKGDKAGLWEGGTRVPAFIYGKGIPQGHVSVDIWCTSAVSI